VRNDLNADKVIRVEQLIDAPREEVFRAWTEPEKLKQWWSPGGYTTKYAEVDLRTGGRYLLVMQPPDGEPFHLAGTYREIVAPERLVYTWKWEVGVPIRRSLWLRWISRMWATRPVSRSRTEGFRLGPLPGLICMDGLPGWRSWRRMSSFRVLSCKL
jgi:uncharacterized protein YndB with AHSA1/START domain